MKGYTCRIWNKIDKFDLQDCGNTEKKKCLEDGKPCRYTIYKITKLKEVKL